MGAGGALAGGLAGGLAAAAGQAWRAAVRAAASVAAAVRAGARTVQQARETVEVAHRLVLRADRIVAELEEPLTAAAPGLRRLARTLDDPLVRDLPDTLRHVQQDVLPVLRTLTDTHERVAFIAGSTERILAFADDTSRALAGIPGAALLGRRRTPARVLPVSPLDPDGPSAARARPVAGADEG